MDKIKEIRERLEKASVINGDVLFGPETATKNQVDFYDNAPSDIAYLLSRLDQVKARLEQAEGKWKWKKQVPNKEGLWLRINAAGRPEMSKVFKDSDLDNKLSIYWGWSPQSKILVEKIKDRLNQFLWCGPFSEPRTPPERTDND
jgi:hypothetical protein